MSPWETICMKCQIVFSRNIKKHISKWHLLKFLPSLKSAGRVLDVVVRSFHLPAHSLWSCPFQWALQNCPCHARGTWGMTVQSAFTFLDYETLLDYDEEVIMDTSRFSKLHVYFLIDDLRLLLGGGYLLFLLLFADPCNSPFSQQAFGV